MAVVYISWSCKSGGDLALNTMVNKLLASQFLVINYIKLILGSIRIIIMAIEFVRLIRELLSRSECLKVRLVFRYEMSDCLYSLQLLH